ncbi:hypothetical protein Tco_0798592 [Tanacetum coccineum]
MVELDDEIKVLGEVNVELESDTKKLREKPSQEEDSEEEALEEFNLTLDNILEKLSQEKDSPDDFYVIEEFVLYTPIHEDVVEEVIEMANYQDEALSDQEVTDECLDDE